MTAAESGPVVYKLPGPDRAMLYRVAAVTGFRANELRSLTPESFDLDSDLPAVTVAAAYSKRRRDDRSALAPGDGSRAWSWIAYRPRWTAALGEPDQTHGRYATARPGRR